MKTVRKWADHLPEPIRSQFLENWIAAGYDIDEVEFDSVKDAIFGYIPDVYFVWTLTAQGGDYWFNIWVQANEGRFDIPPHIQAATIADDEQAD